MRTNYLFQPFLPGEQHLGNQLKSLLNANKGRFDEFTAFVAFVKFSGVSRLFSALQAFKDAGGRSTVVAGIDQRGTTRQGLDYLRKVVTQVFIYHDESMQRRTFHPKVYMFEQTRVRAVVLLGSGNLTAGGLFTNYESHLRLEFDLQNEEDQKSYEHFRENCRHFLDTNSPCLKALDDELFGLIFNALPDESQSQQGHSGESETDDEATPPTEHQEVNLTGGIFGTSKFIRAPKPDISLGNTRAKSPREAESAAPAALVVAETESGFWKVLSNNDVSRSGSPGQIIIPIGFRDFFGPLRLTQSADAGGKGRQWESNFPVQFRDGSFTRTVRNARYIVYEPKTGHPRKNTESRFTFHNLEVFHRLHRDDMLVFRSSSDSTPKFVIEKLTSKDAAYQQLYRGTGLRYARL